MLIQDLDPDAPMSSPELRQEVPSFAAGVGMVCAVGALVLCMIFFSVSMV